MSYRIKFLRFAIVFFCCQTVTNAQQKLSEDGLRMQVAHEFLFEKLVEGRDVVFTGDTPRYLRRLVLSDKETIVNGELDLPLAKGAEQTLLMFRYVELKGEGLDGLGMISLLPNSPDVPLPVSTHTPTTYRVKLPALPSPSEQTPQAAIRLRGTGTIQSVSLVPFGGGISEVFDSAPYRNLGEEFPPEQVTITVDTEHELSIDGHIEIDRTKWFRYYGHPNCVPRSMEEFAAERNFYPGRQIFKFEPALEKGYSPNQPLLDEDSNRPGYADPTFFEQYKANQFSNPYEPFKGVPFAMCFNDYSSFMSVEHVGRGTPLPDRFDAAADLVSRYLKNQLKHSGQTAAWWELKNEATIKAEWDHHWRKDVDSWGLLSEFHNTVADKVHADVPGVKIGGPASAWMQIQVGNFSLWKNQKRFMDETRGHLDFYSHHFYEDMGTLGAFEKRSTGYRNYLLGRLEAILDMFQAHMHGTDNLRPILLTEYGALNVGKTEADYWLRLRSYSAFLSRLMQRPEQIDMAVPFIFLSSPWDPQNGHSVFVPNGEKGKWGDLKTYRRTADGYFFDLWRDFHGRRLPIHSSNRWLSLTAVHDETTVRIAMSNMGERRLKIPTENLTRGLNANSITQRRLHYVDGEIVYEDAISIPKGDAVSIDPEETTIMSIVLDEPLKPASKLATKSWYAAETAVATDQLAEHPLSIAVEDANEVASAKLYIGLQRNGGLQAPLKGRINDAEFVVDNSGVNAVPEFFECIDVAIPKERLRKINTVTLEAQPGLTVTSLRIETVQRSEAVIE